MELEVITKGFYKITQDWQILYKSLCQDVQFQWGGKQEKAFDDIKHALRTTTLMRHPDLINLSSMTVMHL